MKIVRKLFGLKDSPSKTTTEKQVLTTTDVVAMALGKREIGSQHDKINAAVATLEYGTDLLSLTQTPNKFSKQAIENIASKLDVGNLSLEQLKTDLPKLADQLTIVSYCQDTTHLDTLLDPIENEATLVSLCEEAQSASLRQKLLSKIHSPNQLKRLEKAYKSRDKNSYKLIKLKLDSLKAEEQAKQTLQEECEHYLHNLDLHTKRVFNKDYSQQYDSLKRKYTKLFESSETRNDVLAQKAQHLLNACLEKINEAAAQQAHDTETANELKDNQPKVAEEARSDDKNCKIIAITCSCLSKDITNLEFRASLSDEIDQLRISNAESSGSLDPDYINLCNATAGFIHALDHDEHTLAALKYVYGEQNTCGESAIDGSTADKDTLKKLDRYVKPFAQNPLFSTTYKATFLATELHKKWQAVEEMATKNKALLQQASGQMRKAQAAVRDGHLKRAQGIRYSIAEQLSKTSFIPSHIERQWETLQKSIDDLGDWQSYAIAPKLDDLVNEMKSLAEEPKQAELQATKIKQLQDQWKSITKGSGKKHQTLWEQFKAHSDSAYEVCKKHYDELDEVRTANTMKRDTLVQQLKEYLDAYDWQSADWSQVEKVLISAKKEWREYSPTPRNRQKEQQAEFNSALEPIQNKLDEHHSANKIEKERLINSLQALVDADDLRHAVDVAIKFQKQWKTIGRCRRKDDEALWQAFRGLCDKVFARRDEERDQSRAEIDSKISEAEALLAKAERIVDNDPSPDAASFEVTYRELEPLKHAFESIEDLPKKVDVALAKRFQKILSRAENRLNELQKEKKEKTRQQAFFLKAALVNKQTNATTESEVKQLPSHFAKALQKSMSETEHDSPSIEQLYRELCIQAEVLNDVETPTEDKNLRMQLQVQQMQSGFGQTLTSEADLTERWLSAPNISFAKYESLQERFLSICQNQ